MLLEEVVKLFEALGGEFFTCPQVIQSRITQLKAVIFDWDGVFNSGTKSKEIGSSFAEPDAAGTNYLRLGLWLLTGVMPKVFIITGEYNLSAFQLAQREHFNGVCFRFTEKMKALEWLSHCESIAPQTTAFVFDDVLDLAIASTCVLRIMVRRRASPLLAAYVKQNHLADYITGCMGGEHAVRETCELILGLGNCYEKVLYHRINYSEQYQQFLSAKKSIVPRFFTWQCDKVQEVFPT
ncbi:MAG: phosphatase [Cytophagales bacterium]|nr:phosphatase [Bernardetiaceae bacterium]MDW8211126.1 phosphatase [Cytophagales bacterium]